MPRAVEPYAPVSSFHVFQRSISFLNLDRRAAVQWFCVSSLMSRSQQGGPKTRINQYKSWSVPLWDADMNMKEVFDESKNKYSQAVLRPLTNWTEPRLIYNVRWCSFENHDAARAFSKGVRDIVSLPLH